MNRTTAACLIAVAVFACRAASADEPAPFPDRSHVVIVLDNLGGFANTSTSHPNSNQQDSGANVFGWFPTTSIARFGVHGVFNGVTIGAGLIYAHYDLGINIGELGGGNGGVTEFGIVPRIGYAFAVGPSTAIWLRAGFTYTHQGDSNDNGSSWQLSPGGEAYLVYSPVNHFGLTIGPFGEFGVAGKQTSCLTGGLGGPAPACADQDVRLRVLGFTFGVLADF